MSKAENIHKTRMDSATDFALMNTSLYEAEVLSVSRKGAKILHYTPNGWKKEMFDWDEITVFLEDATWGYVE